MKIISFILFLLLGLASSKPNISAGSRIVGGQIARAGQFPFIAGIEVSSLQGKYFCGGSLISAQHVVTAGHCVDGGREFTVHLGTNKILKPNETGAGLIVATATAMLHPDYNPLTLENDLGVIHLHMSVSFGEYCHPIPVALPRDFSGLYTTILGWGQISDTIEGEQTDLNYVEVVVITNQECRITYGDQVKDSMMCAEGNYNEGLCVGDTGGPLLYVNEHGSELLIGVSTFFSQLGCEQLHPSGFARTDTSISWLQNVTENTVILEIQ